MIKEYLKDVAETISKFGLQIFMNMVIIAICGYGSITTFGLILILLNMISTFAGVYCAGQSKGFIDCNNIWKKVHKDYHTDLTKLIAGLKSTVTTLRDGEVATRQSHNLEIAGSNPAPATNQQE